MNGERILLNPKMSDDDNPIEPYTKDEERTRDPYQFDVDQNGFPVFSDKNIRFVLAMIGNNSSYNLASEDEVVKMYRGVLECDDTLIRQAVYFTNKINSTHLAVLGVKYSNACKDGSIAKVKSEPVIANKEALASYKDKEEFNGWGKFELTGGVLLTAKALCEEKDDIIQELRRQPAGEGDAGDADAVYRIARFAENAMRRLGLEDFTKNNISFASKFCHHTCIKGGLGDRYCIYDSVVGEVLPYYVWAYSDKGEIEKLGDEIKRRTPYKLKLDYSGLKKMISTLVNADAVAGYQMYRELYRSVCDGINKWRSKHPEDCCPSNATGIKPFEGQVGFQEVDRLIWYYFKGRRLEDARETMKAKIR